MLVNKQQYCEWRGITRPIFDKFVRNGMPVHQRPINKGGEYLVYSGDAFEWELQQERAVAGAPTESFEDARIRLTAEQADSYALKNAVLRSELLPAADVQAGWQAAMGRFRAMLIGVATSVSARHVALAHANADDPVKMERAFRENLTIQHDAALLELSNTSVDEVEEEFDEDDELPGEKPLAREGARAN